MKVLSFVRDVRTFEMTPNCSSELRVPFLGDPHHKIYVVVVRRQVFKTATLAGGLLLPNKTQAIYERLLDVLLEQ